MVAGIQGLLSARDLRLPCVAVPFCAAVVRRRYAAVLAISACGVRFAAVGEELSPLRSVLVAWGLRWEPAIWAVAEINAGY